MLTKKDFVEDMDTIEHIYCNHEHGESDFKEFMKCISNIYKYIEQLENNSPLKFEELKPNMWVWDNKEKEYIQLIYHDYGYRKEWLYERIGVQYELEFIFEENRYFRKQVDK